MYEATHLLIFQFFQGLLKWDVVPAEKGSRVVYHNLSNHNGEVFQFAVSANTKEYSSGMMWASCSLLPDKGMTDEFVCGKNKAVELGIRKT